MFDSVDTVNDCIRIATGVLSTIAVNPERMLAGLSADMLATDLAEYLVRKGAPYPIPPHPDRERMLAGLSADMLVTDLAEYLVRKGAL